MSGPNGGHSTRYGGTPLGNDTRPTFFNATPGSVTLLKFYVGVRTRVKIDSFMFEGDLPIGNNVYGLSYDSVST